MKFVLAPDKFKDSLTGLEFCNAVAEGILKVIPEAEIIKLPLADGGDGTLEVANFYLKGDVINVRVNNPIFQLVSATYLYAGDSQTAYIEMAEASGLKLLGIKERDCKSTTTLGTGELILNAINKGAKHIILGIGGSATNDCGIGMAKALEYRFYDKNNNEISPIGKNLSLINYIDNTQVNTTLNHVTFKIACDVINPLYGKNGAAHVYAKQKGASQKDIEMLDKGLQDFSKIIDSHFKIDSQNIIGAGAAGGMGLGTKVFLNGELISGITLIKELSQFDLKIKEADWIITGEGKLDMQTLSGKTIQGVIESAKQQNIKVAAFCGKVELNSTALKQFGISYADEVLSKAKNFEDAMDNSYNYITKMAMDFTEKIKS
ncbi:Glycerate kinase [hydrothermal vent metagenome]|uniref:Glycerate kinase n=1 Tax=hydrothermal vent metagenome TaxID=652676 RepID=A0A3B0QW00_9ZZZZ